MTPGFDLEELLVSSDVLDPLLRKSLPIALRTVRRYQSATNYLVGAAQKFRNFKNIQVVALKPPNRSQLEAGEPFLSASDCLKGVLSAEPELLRNSLTATVTKALDGRPSTQSLIALLQAGKPVHAEIQLLFYYEANPTSTWPRVICSRKSACYFVLFCFFGCLLFVED